MDNQDFSRSRALNNIPGKKLADEIVKIESGSDSIQDKSVKLTAINRYAESNIPLEYWSLKMEKDFVGDPRLRTKYEEYVIDIRTSYLRGTSICFAGNHGLGKTMTATCILKKACQKGYTCLYTNLSDIVSVLINGTNEDKFLARQELVKVDFLVIDEFDPRFMGSENAADLYARSLESVFRVRSQNKLPTIMCTNSNNPVESFNGQLKASIGSLFNKMEIFRVMPGEDMRGKKVR